MLILPWNVNSTGAGLLDVDRAVWKLQIEAVLLLEIVDGILASDDNGEDRGLALVWKP